MKLQDQVCTIEQGKRLMELGVNAPSLFYYAGDSIRVSISEEFSGSAIVLNMDNPNSCHAYTVAELGAMLPALVTSKRTVSTGEWYIFGSENTGYVCDRFKTEAEAKASFLIHLLEQNLITAEECNKRINNN